MQKKNKKKILLRKKKQKKNYYAKYVKTKKCYILHKKNIQIIITYEGLLSCYLVKSFRLFIQGFFLLLRVIYTRLLPIIAGYLYRTPSCYYGCHPKSQQIRVS